MVERPGVNAAAPHAGAEQVDGWRIAVVYSLIAALATAANLASQALVIGLYASTHAVPVSVVAGTAVGLPIRYVLEKRYVFVFRSDGIGHDGRLFLLYSGLGAFTTALFWGVEAGFHFAFQSHGMRYLGGAIGLGLGYWIKYHLDKRFVFVRRAAAVE